VGALVLAMTGVAGRIDAVAAPPAPVAVPVADTARAGGGEDSAGASRSAPAQSSARRAKLTLIETRFGKILADRHGYALYLFTHDKPNRSRCRRACADAWPPLKSKPRPKAGAGVKKKLLRTTKRRNGSRQVTYNGRPLYRYVGDRQPGQVLCQDVLQFGGRWLVVNREGKPIR
jgi:predicted lipoprotein with Yx(FWY)xxD motif